MRATTRWHHLLCHCSRHLRGLHLDGERLRLPTSVLRNAGEVAGYFPSAFILSSSPSNPSPHPISRPTSCSFQVTSRPGHPGASGGLLYTSLAKNQRDGRSCACCPSVILTRPAIHTVSSSLLRKALAPLTQRRKLLQANRPDLESGIRLLPTPRTALSDLVSTENSLTVTMKGWGGKF